MRVNKQCRPFAYQSLHHGRSVVFAMLWHKAEHYVLHILRDTPSVLQSDLQTGVVNGQSLRLVDLPASLPKRWLCTHGSIVALFPAFSQRHFKYPACSWRETSIAALWAVSSLKCNTGDFAKFDLGEDFGRSSETQNGARPIVQQVFETP